MNDLHVSLKEVEDLLSPPPDEGRLKKAAKKLEVLAEELEECEEVDPESGALALYYVNRVLIAARLLEVAKERVKGLLVEREKEVDPLLKELIKDVEGKAARVKRLLIRCMEQSEWERVKAEAASAATLYELLTIASKKARRGYEEVRKMFVGGEAKRVEVDKGIAELLRQASDLI